MTSHVGSSTVRNVPFAGDVDGGGGCVRVWGQGVHGDSVPSTQFCSEPKPVLKNKVYLKGKKKKKDQWLNNRAHSHTSHHPFEHLQLRITEDEGDCQDLVCFELGIIYHLG